MVKKFEKYRREVSNKNNIKADVIILGCSLPGIVTAHKLKKKFGDSMDIVVLDLAAPVPDTVSKCNVVFQEDDDDEGSLLDEPVEDHTRHVEDTVAKHYISTFAKEFQIPIPDTVMYPRKVRSPLNKLFEYTNGSIVELDTSYNDYDYLKFYERFELSQYQNLLDFSMRDLFKSYNVIVDIEVERKKLLYYDQTTMEEHICSALLFATPREIMRSTVRLVCGAGPEIVSVLFYLHQCYRTSSPVNHIDGDNTRFREKILSYCRKRIANKLQQSVADITLEVKPIKEIRTSDEQVILVTRLGETNYVCNLLAMALRPDQLGSIRVEDELLSESEQAIASAMKSGKGKKFHIKYKENFWKKYGYSGDIFSTKGPILWGMERPRFSSSGTAEPAALIGYLKVEQTSLRSYDSQELVVEQLVRLFGEEAAEPISYRESDFSDVYVPRCGDFVALNSWLNEGSRPLDWGAMDVFADGDLAAAIEAGHMTYVRLLSYLRPQAETFEDACVGNVSPVLAVDTMGSAFAHVNVISTLQFLALTAAIGIGVTLFRAFRKS